MPVVPTLGRQMGGSLGSRRSRPAKARQGNTCLKKKKKRKKDKLKSQYTLI
jgi:hypothetical protein